MVLFFHFLKNYSIVLGLLSPHPCVENHLLCDLHGVVRDRNTEIPLLWIDTAGCDCMEETESSFSDDHLDKFSLQFGSESKRNRNEVQLCVQHVKQLLNAKVEPKQIGIISPYAAQIRELRKEMSHLSGRQTNSLMKTSCLPFIKEEIEISTVDGFQGREKEAIILSLVRSNDSQELGFLTDYRRINVAITRARRHICIIGNSDMMEKDPFLSHLVSYCFEHGEIRYATEYDPSLQGEVSKQRQQLTSKERRVKQNKSSNHRDMEKKLEDEMNSCISQPGTSTKDHRNADTERNRMEKQLLEFIHSDSTSIEFSPKLTSDERRLLHQLAEKYSLGHKSVDSIDGRCIQLWKWNAGETFSLQGAPSLHANASYQVLAYIAIFTTHL